MQFQDTVEFCEEMANLGKTVIVAALDGTFQRNVSLHLYMSEWCKQTLMCDTDKQQILPGQTEHHRISKMNTI